MLRARKAGILTPVIFSVQHDAATIFMERIDGITVKETLLSGAFTKEGNRLCIQIGAASMHEWTLYVHVSAAEVSDMLSKIGQVVATLHDGGLVHGDLTTSNMLIRHKDKAVVRIYSLLCVMHVSCLAVNSAH